MTTTDWVVRFFRVSDLEAQRVILGLLDQIDELVAEGCLIGRDPHITVETREIEQAAATRQLIMAIDPDARMLHTASRHQGPTKRAAQVIAAGTA
jgi:hypothetical protein